MGLTRISGDVIQTPLNVGVVTATRIDGDVSGNVNSTGVSTFTTLRVGTAVTISGGIVTATSFVGNISGNVTGNATGLSGTPNITVGNIIASSATISGNVSVAGTVTYDDVTNVDSLGVGTFRSGIVVNTGTATTALVVNGNARVTGILTVGQSSVTIDGTNNKITTPKLDYAGISSTITATAVDVFVYDTRKDSDGGAWRKRTQHTSWYNETLNTATRGSRREFPAVAVIVAETSKVTIYDGDDPDLPMWMVFNKGGAWSSSANMLMTTDANFSSVAMFNGVMCCGNYSGYGLSEVFFLNDSGFSRAATAHNKYGGNIAERNDGKGHFSGYSSAYTVNSTVNDVAMTVLPNAPIDAATGLPIPTIAVATDGGVSVIKDDGTVVNKATTSAQSYQVSWMSPSRLLMTAPLYYGIFDDPFVAESTTFLNSIADSAYYSGDGDGTSWNYPRPIANLVESTAQRVIATDSRTIIAATNSGLNIHELSTSSGTDNNNGIVAYATTSYNTGWMHGNIKGAFLSDTDATNVTGTELVTNGDFGNGTTGWTLSTGAQGGTIVVNGSNQLVITQGSASAAMYASQAVTTVVGKTYVAVVTVVSTSEANYFRMWIGTGINGSNLGTTGTLTTAGTYSITFTATSTTSYITLNSDQNANKVTTWDNASVRIAELDRSVNNKGLQVFGTITKTAVATGADLVAYSGFSGSNYLRHRSSTNYGSSATISFMAWQKTSDTSNYQYAASVWDSTSNKEVGISIGSGSSGYSGVPYIYDGTNSVLQATGISIADGNWHFVVGILNGTTRAIYVDGVLRNSAACTSVNLAAVNYTNVGHYTNDASVLLPYLGSLALVRISATAPSPDQIKKIYNDEKMLFQDNSKATLYGTSSAVTALAYDDSTRLLYAGTSSGRSDFQGLERINNTTTAVTTAISASNGLVAEQ